MSFDTTNTLPDSFFKINDRGQRVLKTRAERQAEEQQATNLAHDAKQQSQIVADQVRRAEPHDERLHRVHSEDIAELEKRLRYCPPLERTGLQLRLNMLKDQVEKIESQQAAQRKLDAFSNDEKVANVRRSAAALARGHVYPGCDPRDLGTLIALSQRTDLSPDELHIAFWNLESKVAADSRAATQAATALARQQEDKGAMERAKAEVLDREVATRQRFVAEQLGGDHE